jgi:redox-sensitive bicupin YhaK (pirin superfamily)
MKYKIRRANERGSAEHGWLHANFTFSFSNYYDPEYCGFHSLIVMNNDIIEPGGGFPTHPHKDAEIFTYVISGELEHRDSMGNGSVIRAGDLQYMSAGSGVTHSEFNPSKNNLTELYQIWMLPNQSGGEPRYAEKKLAGRECPNGWTLLFSGDGTDGSTAIRQDATFSFGQADVGSSLTIEPSPALPHAWIQLVSGALQINGQELGQADGMSIENLDQTLNLSILKPSTLFLFRLPHQP